MLRRLRPGAAGNEQGEAANAREAAMLRTRQSAQPEGGRQEGPFTDTISNPRYLFDMTPPGMAVNAVNSASQGDYGQAAMQGAGAVAPLLGPAARAVGGAMNAFPKTTAIGGGLGAMLSSAEAGSPLNRAQRQQMEMEQQRGKNQLEADNARRAQEAELAAQERAQQVELERARREGDLAAQNAAAQAEMQRQQQQQEAQRAEELRQTQLPFREKFPNVAANLPYAGAAISAALPYGARAAKAAFNNKRVGQAEGAVERGEAALTGRKNINSISRSLSELEAQRAITPPPKGPISIGPGGMATSAAVSAEAPLIPLEYDAGMLPHGNENRQAAWDTLMNPAEVAKRALPGLLGGMTAATIGNKVPGVWSERVPPTANMDGLIAALNGAKAPKVSKPRAPAKKAPATPEENP